MHTLSKTTKEVIYTTLDCQMPIKVFQQWLLTHEKELQKELPASLFKDLISFDFNQPDCESIIYDTLLPYLNLDDFNKWRTKTLLVQIVENKIDPVLGARNLSELYYKTGGNFIPASLGIAYDSELDNVPVPSEYHLWNETQLREKLESIKEYTQAFINEAKVFLESLIKE